MSTNFDTPAAVPLAPIPRTERIQALDVIRGFALIGILLMNIEYFNRPTTDIGSGIQPGLTGGNLWFSYFVMYFVTSKFWTLFSLLFGMGFAVMLSRAEAAGRSFLVPYMRRIAALMVFGAIHHVFIWAGDILFSYSVGAIALLIVLYGRGRWILLAMALLIGAGFIPGMSWTFGIAGGIAFFGACAWYLRSPERVPVFKRSVPVFKIVIGLIMTLALGAIAASFVIPDIPHEGKVSMRVAGTMFFILASLMAKFHQPGDVRIRRMAVGIFVFSMSMGLAMNTAHYLFPDPVKTEAIKRELANPSPPFIVPTPEQDKAKEAKEKAEALAAAKSGAKAEPKKKLTFDEKVEKDRKDRVERLARRKAERDHETEVLSKGSYAEVVAMRGKQFIEHAPNEVGFATLIIAQFLLGLWFVRSGVMTNTAAHLPLFRKLAFIGLPFGVGLGLSGALIATYAIPGIPNGFGISMSLLMLGALPSCVGIAAAIVLMLHSRTALNKIAVLGPFGRMALTNYLTHSIVFSTIFFGYGFGLFGIQRIHQFYCVIAMVAVQIPLSHLWLSHFRYGPMEWLWRAITYWQIPAMRIAPAGNTGGVAHAA